MAAKKKSAFQQIVIKSAEELKKIVDRFIDEGGSYTSEFLAALQYVQNPTNEERLRQWASDLGINLCETGTDKILASIGKVTTWPQYFEKYWNDADGIQDWFQTHSEALTGDDNLEFQTESTVDEDGYSNWDAGDFPTFAAFRKANPGLTFIDFPFKNAKASTKKSTKKSKKR